MLKLSSALRNPFSFLFTRSSSEERVAAYVIREHERGRTLQEILDDPYVSNRLTPQQRLELFEQTGVVVGPDRAVQVSLTSTRSNQSFVMAGASANLFERDASVATCVIFALRRMRPQCNFSIASN